MWEKKRILLLSLIVIVILLFLVFMLRGPRRTIVEVADVFRGDIMSIVSTPGVVRPKTEVQISSSVVGTVEELPVREGQQVKEGELLVRLEQTAYLAQVQRSRANLELTEANLQQSRNQWNRAQQLYDMELISQQEYEEARTQFLLDQARVKEARATLNQAREELNETTITSPLNGTVTQLNIELGETVITGTVNMPGTVLMVVSDLSTMEVECQVDEADIARVRQGQRANIQVEALPGTVFVGSVSEVGYSATQDDLGGVPATTVRYLVDVTIEDSVPALKPDMTATVEIVTQEKGDVLMVPIQAVVTRPIEQLSEEIEVDGAVPGQEIQAVFVYEYGIARLVPVNTGILGENYIEITEGLTEEQTVISGPFSALRELQTGEQVEPQQE